MPVTRLNHGAELRVGDFVVLPVGGISMSPKTASKYGCHNGETCRSPNATRFVRDVFSAIPPANEGEVRPRRVLVVTFASLTAPAEDTSWLDDSDNTAASLGGGLRTLVQRAAHLVLAPCTLADAATFPRSPVDETGHALEIDGDGRFLSVENVSADLVRDAVPGGPLELQDLVGAAAMCNNTYDWRQAVSRATPEQFADGLAHVMLAGGDFNFVSRSEHTRAEPRAARCYRVDPNDQAWQNAQLDGLLAAARPANYRSYGRDRTLSVQSRFVDYLRSRGAQLLRPDARLADAIAHARLRVIRDAAIRQREDLQRMRDAMDLVLRQADARVDRWTARVDAFDEDAWQNAIYELGAQ